MVINGVALVAVVQQIEKAQAGKDVSMYETAMAAITLYNQRTVGRDPVERIAELLANNNALRERAQAAERAARRAAELLRATVWMIYEYDLETHDVEYDGTTCDGFTLSQDCTNAADDIDEVLKKVGG